MLVGDQCGKVTVCVFKIDGEKYVVFRMPRRSGASMIWASTHRPRGTQKGCSQAASEDRAERNCENLVFFEQAHFGNVWKEQRAWTLEKNAFDHEMFAQQYERTVKQLLRCELRSMNGDGASMKVVTVISFVIGDAGEASTREDYAENSYPQIT